MADYSDGELETNQYGLATYGSVYLFNVANRLVGLNLNTQDIGTIRGATAQYSWIPFQKRIGRINSDNPHEGKFGLENTLHVSHEGSRVGPSTYLIPIDWKRYPLARDLQLCLYDGFAVLTFDGQVIWFSPDPRTQSTFPPEGGSHDFHIRPATEA